MKRFLKVLGLIGLFILGIIAVGLYFVFIVNPHHRDASKATVDRSAARVERGRYLVNHVSDCVGCHSERMLDRYTMPIKPGTELAGGLDFSEKGVKLFSANITSDRETGVGAWSDGEIIRAIREGIDRQ